MLRRAIDSALLQTGVEMRVLVVIDGPPDAESEAMVRSYKTEPVSFITFTTNQGPSRCRTAGGLQATTDWIAFLDDDDYWYPDKIRRQLEALPKGRERTTIVATQSHVVTPTGTYCWPRRLPGQKERTGNYLFCRHSLFKGESFLQASSFLCHQDILARFPLTTSKHEDWDWVLHATELGGNQLVIVPEPLVCHLTEQNNASRSNKNNFDESLAWCDRIRRVISPEAYAGLLLQTLNGRLAERGEFRTALMLAGMAFRHGRPRAMDCLLFMTQWLLPTNLRRRLRAQTFQRRGQMQQT